MLNSQWYYALILAVVLFIFSIAVRESGDAEAKPTERLQVALVDSQIVPKQAPIYTLSIGGANTSLQRLGASEVVITTKRDPDYLVRVEAGPVLGSMTRLMTIGDSAKIPARAAVVGTQDLMVYIRFTKKDQEAMCQIFLDYFRGKHSFQYSCAGTDSREG